MVDRMRRWGPILDRLDLKSYAAPASAGAGDTLGITVFARDRRRLLLVFNPSRSEYLRTTLTLDEVVAGVPATRLVEVPGDSKMSLGVVHEARRGRMADHLARRADAVAHAGVHVQVNQVGLGGLANQDGLL